MVSIGPPGSPGPASFPAARGSFFEYWFSQDRETHNVPPPLVISPATGGIASAGTSPIMERNEPLFSPPPLDLMLQAAVTLGEKTDEGHIIEAVSIPWLAFLGHIKRNPRSIYEIDWRKWEEIIAGAYSDSGYAVVLTPRSGDGGRDVIATKEGLLSVRYFDQVKRFSPGHLVEFDDVRGMLGVLDLYGNVSKGIITTTSDFAPGVYMDEGLKRFLPYRLDLRPQARLIEWLNEVASRSGK